MPLWNLLFRLDRHIVILLLIFQALKKKNEPVVEETTTTTTTEATIQVPALTINMLKLVLI